MQSWVKFPGKRSVSHIYRCGRTASKAFGRGDRPARPPSWPDWRKRPDRSARRDRRCPASVPIADPHPARCLRRCPRPDRAHRQLWKAKVFGSGVNDAPAWPRLTPGPPWEGRLRPRTETHGVVIVRTNPPPRPAVVALTQRVGRLVVLNLATAGAFTSDIVACRWACSATRASPSSSSLDGIAPAALLGAGEKASRR
jgi:hypothetical protein